MSVSEVVADVRRDIREDLHEAAANPWREAVETAILLVCGVGFFLRAVIHGTAWLAAYAPDGETGATITMDWGPVANPAVDATAAEAWRISLVTLAIGIGLVWYVSPVIDMARADPLPVALAVANVGVLVVDPLLVQVLPEGEP